MVDQDPHRSANVTNRGFVALASNMLILPLDCGSKQALPVTEVTDHSGQRNLGAACHFLQRNVNQRLLPKHGDEGRKDALACGGCRLCPSGHVVAALRWLSTGGHIHVSTLTRN